MFKRLQEKWKVTGLQLALIFTTFALGGSSCGYLGRIVLGFLQIETPAIRIPVYLVLITLLWPLCVIVISIPFGQFPFFKAYLQKMWTRISGTK